jgi:hypothetical protein
MKKQGCVLLVFGAVFLLAGGGVVLAGLFGVGGPFVAARLPLEPPPSDASASAALDPGQPYSLGVYLEVRSTVVRRLERDRLGLGPERELLYSFPIRCTVSTSDGGRLATVARVCGPGPNRTVISSRLRGDGGSVAARHMLASFEAPRSGKVEVSARLQRDERHGARIVRAEVQVYELSPLRYFVVPASAMVMMAPVLLFIGLVTYVIGRVTGEGKTVPTPPTKTRQADGHEGH